ITSDPAARRLYNNYVFMHGELYSQHASLAAASGSSVEILNSVQSGARRNWANWLAIAAALVGVAAVSSWLTHSLGGGAGGPQTIAQSAEDDTKGVARVTATRNCSWGEASDVGYGSRLHPGQRLNLSTGLVEITFNDGAVVVLEGPAKFDIETPGK